MIHDSGNRKGSVDFSLIRRTLWKWPAFGKKYLCIQRRRVRRPSFHRPWLIAFDPWIIPTLCPIKVFLPSSILETMALTHNFSVAAEAAAETVGIISFFWFEGKRDIVSNELPRLEYFWLLFIKFSWAVVVYSVTPPSQTAFEKKHTVLSLLIFYRSFVLRIYITSSSVFQFLST